ncbi:MAG: hypothetical protein Q8P67_22875, partial [archaeon]|nr:hypothetical protein [archaeon]
HGTYCLRLSATQPQCLTISVRRGPSGPGGREVFHYRQLPDMEVSAFIDSIKLPGKKRLNMSLDQGRLIDLHSLSDYYCSTNISA